MAISLCVRPLTSTNPNGFGFKFLPEPSALRFQMPTAEARLESLLQA